MQSQQAEGQAENAHQGGWSAQWGHAASCQHLGSLPAPRCPPCSGTWSACPETGLAVLSWMAVSQHTHAGGSMVAQDSHVCKGTCMHEQGGECVRAGGHMCNATDAALMSSDNSIRKSNLAACTWTEALQLRQILADVQACADAFIHGHDGLQSKAIAERVQGQTLGMSSEGWGGVALLPIPGPLGECVGLCRPATCTISGQQFAP